MTDCGILWDCVYLCANVGCLLDGHYGQGGVMDDRRWLLMVIWYLQEDDDVQRTIIESHSCVLMPRSCSAIY